jgi:hypothetical protein
MVCVCPFRSMDPYMRLYGQWVWPAPFGRDLTKEEAYIYSKTQWLDWKLTVLVCCTSNLDDMPPTSIAHFAHLHPEHSYPISTATLFIVQMTLQDRFRRKRVPGFQLNRTTHSLSASEVSTPPHEVSQTKKSPRVHIETIVDISSQDGCNYSPRHQQWHAGQA